jgi:hypothetical protein
MYRQDNSKDEYRTGNLTDIRFLHSTNAIMADEDNTVP